MTIPWPSEWDVRFTIISRKNVKQKTDDEESEGMRMKNTIDGLNKDRCCVYAMHKLYNTVVGEDSLGLYTLYGYKG